jgi:hypothetical protein
MGQQALLVFESVIDPTAKPLAWTEITGGRMDIIQCGLDEPAANERIGAEEADYCRARAEAETRRAGEALHPAARAAHLEMAWRYRARAFAAREAGIAGLQVWTSKGGSRLTDG